MPEHRRCELCNTQFDLNAKGRPRKRCEEVCIHLEPALARVEKLIENAELVFPKDQWGASSLAEVRGRLSRLSVDLWNRFGMRKPGPKKESSAVRRFKLLGRLEWFGPGMCPCCGASRTVGHGENCDLDYELHPWKKGLRTRAELAAK